MPTRISCRQQKSLVELLERRLHLSTSSSGTADPSFGISGLFLDPSAANSENFNSATVQPDGKIIVVGSANVGNQTDILVLRLNSDGTLDLTFGSGGRVLTSIDGEAAVAVGLQNNGKIVVASNGGSTIEDSQSSSIVRYLPDGTPDTTFGAGGIFTTTDQINAIAIQNGGKIIGVGNAADPVNSGVTDALLVRLNSDGVPDDSFGTAGRVSENFGSDSQADSSFFMGAVVLPDGEITAAGQVGQPVNTGDTEGDYLIMRFTSSGSLDRNFDPLFPGYVITDVSNSDAPAGPAALLPNGGILLNGVSDRWLSTVDRSFVEYDANGGFASNFNNGSPVTIDAFGSNSATDLGDNTDAVVESNGQIIASSYLYSDAGHSHSSATSGNLLCLNPDATPDVDFGSQGEIETSASGVFLDRLALQPDGKIIGVGFYHDPSSGNYYPLVTRYLPPQTIAADALVDGSYSRLALERFDGQVIDPTRPTWLVIHGLDSAPSSADINELADVIQYRRPKEQVLTLDWSAAADTYFLGMPDPIPAENAIPDVAQWAASMLQAAGFHMENLNIVGHSFGSYVGEEIALDSPIAINTIVALDPAQDANLMVAALAELYPDVEPLLAALNQTPSFIATGNIDFKENTNFSWAFKGSPLGNAHTASTATEAFQVVDRSSLNPLDEHSDVVTLFSKMLLSTDSVSQWFSLDRLLAGVATRGGPWRRTGKFNAQLITATDGPEPASLSYIDNSNSAAIVDTTAIGVGPDGILSVTGTDAADSIYISDSAGMFSATMDTLPSQSYPDSMVQQIVIDAGAGNDVVVVNHEITVAAQIHGAGGDDTLVGGGGNDSIFGGAGNDSLLGAPGNDVVIGGAGADTILGGGGDDTLAGGPGDDSLVGGPGVDSMTGGVGNDTMNAAGGAGDTLDGGDGIDLVLGVVASDLLVNIP